MSDTMRALVGADTGSGYHLAQDAPIPVPPPGMLLVRVHSVGFNPPDAHKTVDYLPSNAAAPSPAGGGCGFAGTVAGLGEGVTRFQVGDRVLVCSFGPVDTDMSNGGAFAEFALAEQDSSYRVPDTMDFAEACSIAMGLAAIDQLSMMHGGDNNNTTTVLVSGGTTPTGIMATQLLKMAGYTPIVTCAPADNALCQEYGAAACFDSHSPACGADARVHTDNSLLYALDFIADDISMKMCYEAVGSGSSYYYGLKKPANAIAIKYTRRDVRADWRLAGGVQILGGGLDNLPAALEDLKTGSMHNAKTLIVPLMA
ncbi:chaperonin 10-like protein [Microdochium trichocladiopsis]|uniref:Chaperonin 10-like protein n=1 Tax=Microdochium trichocladiopsis TaxID=1682393 RepID=A0A9P8XVI5_9PEZI|nr:chaperonin 10-like protein [Microdochium trichocladiopsis]KAH7014518.1 chaperonin 10-like protein [Microdochium trichocladiopsis]